MTKMDSLLGRTITGYGLEDHRETLRIETDKGPLRWATYADCCSRTWFEDVSELGDVIGHKVTKVESVSMDDIQSYSDTLRKLANEDDDHYGEVVQLYGYKLTTTGGRALIEFRNSSNGYYGGSIEEIKS